jgi:peptide/nickel transport system substrate-binding protein
VRNPRTGAKIIALFASAALVLTACGGGGDANEGGGGNAGGGAGERAAGGTITYGADQEPTGFNGNTSKDNGTSVKNVNENLFYYAAKAKPDYTLDFVGLEGAPSVISEDPQVVEWKIKQAAAWSDGTPITTADIQYYYENIINPANDVASRVGYDQISKFEAVDDKTFRATFDPKLSEYEVLWADVPQAAFMKAQPGGWNTGLDSSPGPSAGPYLLLEGGYVPGESLTLVRNDQFWGEPKPTLDSIVFRFLPESTTQADALRNQEVDMIYPQPQLDLVEQVGQLEPDVISEIRFGSTFEHLTFNLANPVLAELPVRQAIAHAVDRNLIVERLMKPFSADASRLDNRVYLTNQAGYEAHGEEYAEQDLAAAKALMEGAGWVLGPDGIYAKGGQRAAFRLLTTAGNALREQQLELVRSQLAEAGMEATIDNCPSTCVFGERLPQGNFDIANFAWVGGTTPVSGVTQLYTTGSDSNYGGWSNPEWDALGVRALSEFDEAARIEMGNQLDTVLWDEMVVLPLYQKPNFLAVTSNAVGIEAHTTFEGPFYNSQAWGVKSVQ